jgi:glycosyltransferase involved in cell wall biosynthesis
LSAHDRLKVLFVIPTLGGGGAEKLLIHLLNRMDRSAFAPALAVFNRHGVFADRVPGDVRVVDLEKGSRYGFLRLQWRIARAVRGLGADVVVAMIGYTNHMVLLSRSLFGWRRPVVAGTYSTLSPALLSQTHAWLRKLLTRRLYPKAEAVVTVSKGAARDLMNVTLLPPEKVRVIYNPVDVDEIRALAGKAAEGDGRARGEVLAVGRLTAAKDYPTLLRAFKIVSRSVDAVLTIIGEGEERSALEALARDLGLEGRVSMPGFVSNQYEYMARADILVLSSAWEGFPTVIEEAMACGTPVVATDCPSGPREIIADGENGLLVPVGSVAGLAGAISRLLEDRALRGKFSRAGARRVEEFGVERITRQYESLILEVAGRGRSGGDV